MKEIRVASLVCGGTGGVDASLERAAHMIEEASYESPDLICFPEIFAWVDLSDKGKLASAELVGSGKVSLAIAEMARKYRVNILTALVERENDRIYNSMVWLDRKGLVAGTYRKVFPTDYEMAAGISPGPLDFNAFDTEYGPVGCCICFDINFREIIDRLAEQQVRLVIFPSMFQGIALMKAWAKLYRMYFVSVPFDMSGAVVDPLGKALVEPWKHGPIMMSCLNLDYVVLHADYNSAKFPAVLKTYGSSVEIRRHDMESSSILLSRHLERSAEQIANEFNLEPETEYLKRSAEIRRRRLSG